MIIFFFPCFGNHRVLHSFPTRRSSDLAFKSLGGVCPIHLGSLDFYSCLVHTKVLWHFSWRNGRVVMHRIANPWRSVRFRLAPPAFSRLFSFFPFFLFIALPRVLSAEPPDATAIGFLRLKINDPR